ncbi:adenosine deaminase [Treponema parvum]|nr:adenosine deaminase [Treponema parvum]
MEKELFYSFMKKIPKAEIHLHIEAVAKLHSIEKLYEKRFGKKITDAERDSFFSYTDLNGFIQAFLKVQDLFLSVDDFNLVFEDFAEYLSEDNIVYCEAFFAPSAFIKKGFNYKDMIDVFTKNIVKIKREKNITIKLLLDVSRTFGCENAMRNYALLKQFPCEHILGIGLGGAEQKGPAREFEPVFTQAHKDGFHAVAHAGEDVGPESVWDSINLLHAERIGHGITSVEDPKLVDYLKDTQLPLEICPTSNVFTKKVVKKIEDHPIRQLYDKNVLVTVNTDDPVFFKVGLIDEYWNLYSKLNFTMDEIKQLVINGFNSTFLSDAEKKSYIKNVKAAWKKASAE